MSGEKKRHRWKYSPVLIEENITIDSKSITTTTRTEEEKHTENTIRKWYNNNDGDSDDDDDDGINQNQPQQTISEKIERVLRKINAWTNEKTAASTDTNDNNIQREPLQDTSFNKTSLSTYDYIRQEQECKPRSKKPTSNTLFNSLRQRCSSSTFVDPNTIKTQHVSVHRPHSMIFTDEPISSMTTTSSILNNNNNNYFYDDLDRKKKMPDTKVQFSSFRHKKSSGKHPVLINLLDNNKPQRRSLFSPYTNLAPLSSMYGSDFFYPSTTEEEKEQQQQQHEYDNLTFIQNSSHHNYDPFPILVDCQHCNRTIDRSSFRDTSCQVPSDDDDDDEKNVYQDVQIERHKTKRSSPLYISPTSTPPLCQPPMAINLLSPYHFRRKRSLSSYFGLHNRSKSAPSASSSTVSSNSSRIKHLSEKKNHKKLQPTLSPLQTVTTVPSLLPESAPVSSTPSTTALLRSIKTSIYAMKKRLKDIRRLSEDSNVTTVLDDYTARSSQELTVSKGQHVRVVQRQPPNAPDWCLIRVLNDHHNPSSPSSLAASSTTITTGSIDLPSPSSSKYIEGLVPAAILKSTKSSASNIHPLPPLALSTSTNKTEQDSILNNTDDSQSRQQQQSPAVHFSKRKASFRRILKNPVRRLSLKDNSSSKDVKNSTPRDLVSVSASIISTDSGDGISNNNKKQSISSNSTTSSKIKVYIK
ncbi:unnamed protein product [Rotaria sp. Silwood2]|nr:unnamed protein product [Rotaria sp. Silwood2]